MADALYLGIDASTQGVTAIVIEPASRRVILEHSLNFDADLPEYGTSHGVITSDEGRTVGAPAAMWADALDAVMAAVAASGLDLSRVRAVSGAAQQHGSVYLSEGFDGALRRLNPAAPLAEQIAPLLTRAQSPVWLDCSTTAECRALSSAMGGDDALARLTGSRAYERFTAAQIRKFATTEPAAYANTGRIHLVSSFLASLLAGRDAPLEPADASGMNLMDLAARDWSPAALGTTAPDLARRLPPIRDSWTTIGGLAPYWRRYGFGPSSVVAWSGDNPSSLVGLGLVETGVLAISLGTSDTVFGPIARPAHDPAGAGHVFGSPAGGYMGLTCFANGSLAREAVRDSFGLDWRAFSAALRATRVGNGGALMLPWFVPEITPLVRDAGVHRLNVDAANGPQNVRAIVEAQAMAMRLHSRWIADNVREIRATGGAAGNREILQVIADVFDAPVVRLDASNASALGAALRACHAERLAAGHAAAWTEVVAGFTDPDPARRVTPDVRAVPAYADLLPRYAAFEASRRG